MNTAATTVKASASQCAARIRPMALRLCVAGLPADAVPLVDAWPWVMAIHTSPYYTGDRVGSIV